MITLALDASTYRGTVAVIRDRMLVHEAVVAMKGAEVERLMPAVEAALKANGITVRDLDRVVCGEGPGSFTSLRIAGSIAKGIALGASVPVYAVSSLALVVAGNDAEPGRYLVAMDAMREESYVALVELLDDDSVASAGSLRLVPTPELEQVAAGARAALVGPAHGDGWSPHARGVMKLEGLLAGSGPVDLASWEPLYGRLAEAQVKWEAAHGRPLAGA